MQRLPSPLRDLDESRRESLDAVHIANVVLDVSSPTRVGETPGGHRQVFDVPSGTISGSYVQGTLATSSGDWMVLRPDDVARIDVRCVFRTKEGGLVHVEYGGLLTGFTAVSRALAAGSTPHPDTYYFRTTVIFETAEERHAWLNRLVSVGYGRLRPGSVEYRVFAVT